MRSRTVLIFFISFAALLWFGGFFTVIILQKMGFLSGILAIAGHSIAVLLPATMIATLAYGYSHASSINAVVHSISSTWVVLVSGLFMAALLGGTLYSILAHAGRQPSAFVFGWVVIGAGLLYGVFGIMMARNAVTHEVSLDVPVGSPLIEKRVALVSDLHLGLIQRKPFLERVIRRLNKTNADLVIIAGDLIDGPKFDYASVLSSLEDIAAPVVYVPGNHERYNQDQNAFYTALPNSVITLQNNTTEVQDITILGIDDQPESDHEMLERVATKHTDPQPDIVVLHDPKHREALLGLQTTLVVSGHTHGGQLFPSTVLVRRLYQEKTAGLVTNGSTNFFTTVGIGTGGTPARIGTRPEVVVFSFVGKE